MLRLSLKPGAYCSTWVAADRFYQCTTTLQIGHFVQDLDYIFSERWVRKDLIASVSMSIAAVDFKRSARLRTGFRGFGRRNGSSHRANTCNTPAIDRQEIQK